MFIIDNNQLPNWAEFLQVIIAAIGMIAAIIGAWKLIARDRQRESEISSLSNIAEQLGNLQVLNEKRYVESKKPHIEVICNNTQAVLGVEQFLFKNLNISSQITSVKMFDVLGNPVGTDLGIGTNGYFQEFTYTVTFPLNSVFLKINVHYTVDSNYYFEQEVLFIRMNNLVSIKTYNIQEIV